MSTKNALLLKALKNPPVLYLISRYGTYTIKLINSLFIAVYLGPYYLGIWGFINLVLGYVNQFNFGISNSINVIISVNKEDDAYVQKVIGNGIFMIVILSSFLSFFFVLNQLCNFNLGAKYNFSTYAPIVCAIGILTHFNNLFTYIIRVCGKLFAIAVNQTLFPLLTLILILFFKGEELLWALVIANLIATVASFILLIIQIPFKLKPLFNCDILKKVQGKAWFLFLFNTSFHLIIITTNSFISENYSVEEFGYFTFSYSLANVIILLLSAIAYIVNPKMLNRFANCSNENTIDILNNIRIAYVSLTHLLVHIAILVFPVFLLFFENYRQTGLAFKIVALTVALYSNSFGYQGLLIARNREREIGLMTFCALIINIVLTAILIYCIHIQFSYVMFATMITYYIYTLASGIVGRRELNLPYKIIDTMKDVFPIRMIIPYGASILLVFISSPDIYFIIPPILYIVINFRDLMHIKRMIIRVIKNPNFINI